MTPFLKNMAVVARRDFLAIVATPTFLLFLLAPLFMLGMSLVGGLGASQLADSARGAGRIVVVAGADDVAALRSADTRLRDALGGRGPATLDVRIASPKGDDPLVIAQEKGADTYAVMVGPLAAPRIVEREEGSRAGRYLALLAEEVLRDRAAGAVPPVAPHFESIRSGGTSIAVQQSMGFGAVFAIFLMTLLLAGQTVSSLAEEKGNKVIEILAAAVPLESVFLGKLLGMLGVAVLFIAFWLAMAAGGGLIAATQIDPATLAAAGDRGDARGAGHRLGLFRRHLFRLFHHGLPPPRRGVPRCRRASGNGPRNPDAQPADHHLSGRDVQPLFGRRERTGQPARALRRNLSLFIALRDGGACRDRRCEGGASACAWLAVAVGRARHLPVGPDVPRRGAERQGRLEILETAAARLMSGDRCHF